MQPLSLGDFDSSRGTREYFKCYIRGKNPLLMWKQKRQRVHLLAKWRRAPGMGETAGRPYGMDHSSDISPHPVKSDSSMEKVCRCMKLCREVRQGCPWPVCREGRGGTPIKLKAVCQVWELGPFCRQEGAPEGFSRGGDSGQICSLERSFWQSYIESSEQE